MLEQRELDVFKLECGNTREDAAIECPSRRKRLVVYCESLEHKLTERNELVRKTNWNDRECNRREGSAWCESLDREDANGLGIPRGIVNLAD